MVTGLGCEACCQIILVKKKKKKGVKSSFFHIQRLKYGSLFSDLKLQAMTLTPLSFLAPVLHSNDSAMILYV